MGSGVWGMCYVLCTCEVGFVVEGGDWVDYQHCWAVYSRTGI
jgi:hypothetical protein